MGKTRKSNSRPLRLLWKGIAAGAEGEFIAVWRRFQRKVASSRTVGVLGSRLTLIFKRCKIYSMKRTQIQLPDSLYAEVKRVARKQEWSVAEVLRRGAEYMVACYPADRPSTWTPPEPRSLGAFLAPVSDWRGLAEAPEDRL